MNAFASRQKNSQLYQSQILKASMHSKTERESKFNSMISNGVADEQGL